MAQIVQGTKYTSDPRPIGFWLYNEPYYPVAEQDAQHELHGFFPA